MIAQAPFRPIGTTGTEISSWIFFVAEILKSARFTVQ